MPRGTEITVIFSLGMQPQETTTPTPAPTTESLYTVMFPKFNVLPAPEPVTNEAGEEGEHKIEAKVSYTVDGGVMSYDVTNQLTLNDASEWKQTSIITLKKEKCKNITATLEVKIDGNVVHTVQAVFQ